MTPKLPASRPGSTAAKFAAALCAASVLAGCALPNSSLGTNLAAGQGEAIAGAAVGLEGAKPKLKIVTTTAILADLVQAIAGERAEVTSLVPGGADPHTWEPSLRNVRDVAYADLAFSNHLLLEEHALMRVLEANLPRGSRQVALAENATNDGVRLIPLVEDVSLDTVWLGLRAGATTGSGEISLANSASGAPVRVSVTGLQYRSLPGGGQALAQATSGAKEATVATYLTGTFGQPTPYWQLSAPLTASTQGQSQGQLQGKVSADGGTITLPAGSHTHLSWAFNLPGIYSLEVAATWGEGQKKNQAPQRATLTFLVGSAPEALPEFAGRTAIDHGHLDLAVRLSEDGQEITGLEIYGDAQNAPTPAETAPAEEVPAETAPAEETTAEEATAEETTAHTHQEASPAHTHGAPAAKQRGTQASYALDDSVVVVPSGALTEVPALPEFRFLGRPGARIYQLAQAVLGKHVHGEIDPHTWQDVKNAQAYTRTIAAALSEADPAGAPYYAQRLQGRLKDLKRLDKWISQVVASIPARARKLVTTHDAYGYWASAYGIEVAGFVTPNPALEPTPRDALALARTLDALQLPAVFLEPNVATHSPTLVQMAKERGIEVCRIYGDAFDQRVSTYIDMMQANALSLKECLDPGSALPPVPFPPAGAAADSAAADSALPDSTAGDPAAAGSATPPANPGSGGPASTQPLESAAPNAGPSAPANPPAAAGTPGTAGNQAGQTQNGQPAGAASSPATATADLPPGEALQLGGGSRVIRAGHIDIGPRLVQGQWVLAARDDTQVTPVWRALSDLELHLQDSAILPVPASGAYAQMLGAKAGQKVWVIPQSQLPTVPWLGWNTQSPEVLAASLPGVNLEITGLQYQGPAPQATLTVFIQAGNFGAPQALFQAHAQGGKSQVSGKVFVENNTHTHANWVFDQPGHYRVQLRMSGAGPAGGVLNSTAVLNVRVG